MLNLKEHFSQLQSMEDRGITYLDSAATSLKLKACVEAQNYFDLNSVSNVHRGAHRLSGEATSAYEASRTAVAKYLNCNPSQIVFTKGTTDSINLVAHHYLNKLGKDDVILLSEMEHHSNLLPWQRVSQETGAKLSFLNVDETGELNLEEIKESLHTKNVKVLSLCHVSNTLGTVNNIKKISEICKDRNVDFLVDGAQAVTFMRPDLKDLNTDFYTFSLHKLFGPFGVGVLFLKDATKVDLYQYGGGIVTDVDFEKAEYVEGPQKFETGTPNISGVVSLKALFDFLSKINFEDVIKEEKKLLSYANLELSKIKGFKPVGTSESRVNILSFNFEGVHANDLCELLDEQGLALRSGHHCTKPLLKKRGLSGCARASFSIYNTKKDVDKLINAIKKTLGVLR